MSGSQQGDETEVFWQVMCVFDPDGEGSDFAYTVGLAGRGYPELHLWARPTEGDDPGADWVLSPQDRGHILNAFAADLLAGRVGVGMTVEHAADEGAALIRFRFDPPVAPVELDAFALPEDCPVIPIRWSLHRYQSALTGGAA